MGGCAVGIGALLVLAPRHPERFGMLAASLIQDISASFEATVVAGT
jgi:3-deoxy-D-manno-octulosonic-acid transferase